MENNYARVYQVDAGAPSAADVVYVAGTAEPSAADLALLALV